jgi:N-acyl homoserine lactone hydrolase
MQLYLLELAVAGGYPIPGYLIHLDDGRWVLVDTGPAPRGGPPGDPASVAERWATLVSIYGAESQGARDFHDGDAERALPAQLERLGLAPRDVSIVVTTHLDHDHAGNHHLFPHAEHWIQAEQLAWARASTAPRVALNRASWSGLTWRPVSGDAVIAPGLRVIATPGHVPGHQSVLVHLPNTGAVLLAVDAVNSAQEFRSDRAPGYFDEDGAASRATTRDLLDLCRRERVVLTVFGHDPAQWPTLRHAPHFYD